MADVASTLANWSSTTDSNSPSGATNIGTGLDNNLREIQGVVVRGLSHKGSDIASATAPALGATEGLFHDITGTATITGFDTVRAGILKIVKFEGALTLTHNATSLILPGGANITTADKDVAFFISEGSGNWRCLSYSKANGASVSLPTGAVMPYAGATEPTGWLFCYGQTVSQATYPALYAILGTTYGSDAGGNFTLPDLRGRVVAGQDDMGGSSANRLTNLSGGLDGDTLGTTGGAESHTLTSAQQPFRTANVGASQAFDNGDIANLGIPLVGLSASTSNGGAHNNVQPTIILNYIIKT